MAEPLFIFKRNGYKTYALSREECIKRESQLKQDGWSHTHTIDPCAWLTSFVESNSGTQAAMLHELRRESHDV